MAAEKPELSKYRDRMDKSIAALKEEFGGLRTGRASTSLLDTIMIEVYGSHMPLNQVGTVTTAASKEVAQGRVISQDPQAGDQVDPDSTVSFVVSDGKPVGVLTRQDLLTFLTA